MPLGHDYMHAYGVIQMRKCSFCSAKTSYQSRALRVYVINAPQGVV